MQSDRTFLCGCKGIRTCLICEKEYGLSLKLQPSLGETYSYCWNCSKCHLGENKTGDLDEIPCSGEGLKVDGIFIRPDFISPDEEIKLIESLDQIPWTPSQSGRRKQNFGPKCNFKKRKLKLGDFKGFPVDTKFIQERFKSVDLLKDFQTIEQCSLEYDPSRGASIDPHIDDCWIWGERIITVNLLSNSVLTLKPYSGSKEKYNLDCVLRSDANTNLNESICLRVPMPRRSLLVLYGEARYDWLHLIYREDIERRRVCLAYREFTQPYLKGGQSYHLSQEIFSQASNFF